MHLIKIISSRYARLNEDAAENHTEIKLTQQTTRENHH